MTTTTFMTNDEYAQFKKYANMTAFEAAESFPNATALNMFRESVWAWMVGYIGNTNARSTYSTSVQYKLRDIEYRGVELLISGEIAKNKIENYISNAILDIFGDNDKLETDVQDDSINRGVTEG